MKVNTLFEQVTNMINNPNAAIPMSMYKDSMNYISTLERKNGRIEEREEIVCRLLASGISCEEISVILKIKLNEIQGINRAYATNKIPDYARKLKVRRRSRNKINSQ